MTVSGLEIRIADKLHDMGVCNHFFRVRKVTINRGRKMERLAPAFGRYIFVNVQDDWQAVLAIDGVIDFVRQRNRELDVLEPAVVPDIALSRLLLASDQDDIMADEDDNIIFDRYQPGDWVQISDRSSWSGHLGRYAVKLPGGIAVVTMMLFGREFELQVEERNLYPSKSPDEIERDLVNKRKARRSRRRSRQIPISSSIELAN